MSIIEPGNHKVNMYYKHKGRIICLDEILYAYPYIDGLRIIFKNGDKIDLLSSKEKKIFLAQYLDSGEDNDPPPKG